MDLNDKNICAICGNEIPVIKAFSREKADGNFVDTSYIKKISLYLEKGKDDYFDVVDEIGDCCVSCYEKHIKPLFKQTNK